MRENKGRGKEKKKKKKERKVYAVLSRRGGREIGGSNDKSRHKKKDQQMIWRLAILVFIFSLFR